MLNRKIVISVNTAWNIYNFRSGLVKALLNHGYQVLILAPKDAYAPRLTALGCGFLDMPMDNHGTHPGRDFSLLMRYVQVLRSVRPLAYLGYTIKPNVYGSIAAQALRIPVINNITGLGTTFVNNTLLSFIVKKLYRLSLRQSRRVFFQNADDQGLFIRSGLVRHDVTDRLPGSGVDLLHFTPSPDRSRREGSFRFLLVARMLKDKGIEEFAAAAELVRRHMPTVEFHLLGFVDESNSNAIPLERIRTWEKNGLIHYVGETEDVRPHLAEADCIVLPSYREGVPHSLLEAAAMARPIIATNAVGCQDIVDDQVSGLLCQVRNPGDLAEKMMQMIRLSPENRVEMGQAGRQKVMSHFDEKIVIRKYLETIDEIAGTSDKLPQAGQSVTVKYFERG